MFLVGPEIEGEVESLTPGDTDECRVEGWENWEKMQLRLVFDQELGGGPDELDALDEIRREYREHLDWAAISRRKVNNWVKEFGDRLRSVNRV